MINLPSVYLQEMKLLLKDEFESFLSSYDKDRFSALRINRLKITNEEFESLMKTFVPDMRITTVPWCNSGYYYDKDSRPAKLPYYNAGLYYIQEPSAMSPVEYLDIQEGMKVLDLCSAPGGKSTQIASLLNNTGLLVSNDISGQRIKAVLRNIEIMGITNALIMNDAPEKIALRFSSYFDRILLDVPCSGEGMFRKDPDLIKTYESSKIANPDMQKRILSSAAAMLKPGGLIMYSTCTFNIDENENQIKDFISNNPDFELINIEKKHGFESGIGIYEACRLFPHKVNAEGHFLCLMKKSFNGTGEEPTDQTHHSEISRKNKISKTVSGSSLPNEYLDFQRKNLNISIDGIFTIENNRIYKELQLSRNLSGLKIIRNGLFIGEIKNSNFIPSPAFIMSLKKCDFKNTLDYNVNDENLIKYLKCETIFADVKNGIIVICVDGFPLGYGKAKNGTVKNHYNKNWRLL